ncbi:F5/8 type C domain-containing protein [Saccharothrix carnea]|uniref:F5/8 type C domain-containing protein n=1 Tax=Saccharothrix carnea TaxID=1280637 RepID=A0A2P8ICL7_SACCR|nr:discoidin domain-containing protein [Saccharothrix carnea]PSL56212.1 F5/8 type C domain-containing protein [Saccharothrix carnea]
MPLSRRTFLGSALAASALTTTSSPAGAASPPGDVVGKITVGYQGWFAARGDRSPLDGWWHWSHDWGQPPSPTNHALMSWPDMTDYANKYTTAFGTLGNGQPATVFSNHDYQTVDVHFRWMREYGCDTAALQRFNPTGGEGPIRDAVTAHVRRAAEAHGVKFYLMYDVTNWTNMQSEIKADWTDKMRAYTSSPMYARQNGKPVVCIWGFGFNDPGRPFTPQQCQDVVDWFKGQGVYLIGGVPTHWRREVEDSRPGFAQVYRSFHMISPWMVGRIGTVADADHFFTHVNSPDQAECDRLGIDYQPCVLPGDLSRRHRAHGDFMWRQFYNMVRLGVQGIYISMFDEYNEANQIAKTPETQAGIPVGSGFLALDEDGTRCSSDYYLRLTGDGGRMLKGQLALTAVRPTKPMPDAVERDLAAGRPTTQSSQTQHYGSHFAVDADPHTYWESANSAFPQWIGVDLGTVAAPRRMVLSLPPNPAWGRRTQTIAVEVGTGTSFTTVLGPTGYVFDPATGNAVTVALPAGVTARHVRLRFSGNTGWPAGQLARWQVFG